MPHNLGETFELATADRNLRTILQIAGAHGTGKTSFTLSGPAPHVLFSWDRGTEGVIEDFVERGKEVYVREYDWAPGAGDFSQAKAVELRDQFINDYHTALHGGARLITADKENDLWELFRYAEFGKPNDQPKDYVKLNQRYKALLNEAKSYDVSVALIDGMKDDWGLVGAISGATGKRSLGKTGTQSRRGFDSLGEIVFAELTFRREEGEFYIDVGKCRQNTALQDQTFTKADVPDHDENDPKARIDFAGFGQLLIPGSTREEWL